MFNHAAESPQVYLEEAQYARQNAQRQYATARRLESDAKHYLDQAALCERMAVRLAIAELDVDANREYASAAKLRALAVQALAQAPKYREFARAANGRARRYEEMAQS